MKALIILGDGRLWDISILISRLKPVTVHTPWSWMTSIWSPSSLRATPLTAPVISTNDGVGPPIRRHFMSLITMTTWQPHPLQFRDQQWQGLNPQGVVTLSLYIHHKISHCYATRVTQPHFHLFATTTWHLATPPIVGCAMIDVFVLWCIVSYN